MHLEADTSLIDAARFPGRRAHDAVCKGQSYIQDGRRWVVDVDLEKFFDRVSHEVMMESCASGSRTGKMSLDIRLRYDRAESGGYGLAVALAPRHLTRSIQRYYVGDQRQSV